MAILLSDEEFQAFYELEAFCFKLYVTVLRRYMDYSTGIVGGVKRRISLRCMQEAMYVKPKRGIPANKTGTPHESKIRRSLENLKAHGIIDQIPHKMYLIFHLPLAIRDKSVQKIPDANSTPITDANLDTLKTASRPDTARVEALKHAEADANLDTPKTSIPDTPPVSGKTKDIPVKNTGISKKKNKTQLPPDFKVTENHMALAKQNNWPDPNGEIEAFKDYHLSRGTKFLDWDRAFNTWLRNAKKFGGKTGGGNNQSGNQPNSFNRAVENIINSANRSR